jgi:hypothetical protein
MTAISLPQRSIDKTCVESCNSSIKGGGCTFQRVMDGSKMFFLEDSTTSFESLSLDDGCSSTAPLHEKENFKRRVSFSEELIADVWERPKTLPEDRHTLFYSGTEISNFRSEYRTLIRNKLAKRNAEFTECQSAAPSSQSSLSLMVGYMQRAAHLVTGSLLPSPQNPPETVLLVDTLYIF